MLTKGEACHISCQVTVVHNLEGGNAVSYARDLNHGLLSWYTPAIH